MASSVPSSSSSSTSSTSSLACGPQKSVTDKARGRGSVSVAADMGAGDKAQSRAKRGADGNPRVSSSSSAMASAPGSTSGATSVSTSGKTGGSGSGSSSPPPNSASRAKGPPAGATASAGVSEERAREEEEEGLEFEWKEQPQVLRDLVKNLSVLASCVFEIHDAPMDGSVDEDKPFVRVLGMDAFNAAAVHLHYTPTDLVKYVPGTLLVKVELRRLENWLLKKVLPNGYTATLRRYTRSPGFLHGVFQQGSTVRRRTLVLEDVEEDEVRGDYVFNERWRVALPLQLFRCEMAEAVKAASDSSGRKGAGGKAAGAQPRAKVSFELRRDPHTKATYFGILQVGMGEGNDLWLPAPMKEAVEGQRYVEFTVVGDVPPGRAGKEAAAKDGGLGAALASFGAHVALAPSSSSSTEDPMAVYRDMYKRDYTKMDAVFTGMAFSGTYLYKFVEHIDGADFVYLVLSPDLPNEKGVVVPQPALLEHTAGSYAKFRFLLSSDASQPDDEKPQGEADSGQEQGQRRGGKKKSKAKNRGAEDQAGAGGGGAEEEDGREDNSEDGEEEEKGDGGEEDDE